MAWKTFAKMQGTDFDKMPVVFENVVFHRATILPKDGSIKFGLNFFDGTGNFEICESGQLTVSGKITIPEDVEKEELPLNKLEKDESGKMLTTSDSYKELRLRGYDYSGLFRGVFKSDSKAVTGELKWEENWVSFMDTMLQFSILGKDMRELYLPTRIEKVVINPLKHMDLMNTYKTKESNVPVYMYKHINVIKSAGVEMRGLKATLAPRRSGTQAPPTIEKYTFIPNCNTKRLAEHKDKSKTKAISLAVHLVIENSSGALKVKVAEVCFNKHPENTMSSTIQSVIEGEPTLASEVIVVTNGPVDNYTAHFGDCGIKVTSKLIESTPVEQNCHMVVCYDVLASEQKVDILKNLRATIKDDGFILLEENRSTFEYEKQGKVIFTSMNLTTVSYQYCDDKVFVLLKPTVNYNERNKTVVYLTEKNYDWVESVKMAVSKAEETNTYVYFVCHGEELFGALGFMNCVKNEAGGKYARLYFIQDQTVGKFSFESEFYVEQLRKDLISNVCKSNAWGTFRHLNFDDSSNMVPSLPVEHAYINALQKGDLSSLKWIEGPLSREKPDPKDKRVELCTVYYAPINFRDVMLSSGEKNKFVYYLV